VKVISLISVTILYVQSFMIVIGDLEDKRKRTDYWVIELVVYCTGLLWYGLILDVQGDYIVTMSWSDQLLIYPSADRWIIFIRDETVYWSVPRPVTVLFYVTKSYSESIIRS